MEFIVACLVIAVLASYGFACNDEEAHESTNTTYDSVIACGETYCPRCHQEWSCQDEECLMFPFQLHWQGQGHRAVSVGGHGVRPAGCA